MSEKKENILDTAENLFAKHGYEGTTTRMIAEDAGVNIAMLSYYFGSKEKLLAAIMDRFSEDILDLLAEVDKLEYDPKTRLLKWLENYIDYVFSHYRPLIIAYREFGLFNDRPNIVDKTYESVHKIRNHIMEALEEGKRRGIFRNFDTELVIVSMSATIDSVIIDHRTILESLELEINENTLYPQEFIDRVKKHMVDMVNTFLSAKKD